MRAQPLAEVPVRGKSEPIGNAKLRLFEQRRATGIGHFLSEADIVKDLNRRTGDILQRLPGTRILRPNSGMGAYVANSRGAQSIQGTAQLCLPDGRCSTYCPVAVFLDGVSVFGGNPREPAFDVNLIQPSEISGIEFYSGPAQMPAALNATRKTCGALVIWTK